MTLMRQVLGEEIAEELIEQAHADVAMMRAGNIGGAVDLDECRTRSYSGNCRCGKCAKCGWGKHCSLHGPFLGELPGSKPFDHEYAAL